MIRCAKSVLKGPTRGLFVRMNSTYDPLGLKDILNEVQTKNKDNEKKKSGTNATSIDDLLNEFVDSSNNTEIQPNASKFSEVNDIDELSGFLDSLDVKGLSVAPEAESEESFENIISQEKAMFKDAFAELIKESETSKSSNKVYDTLINYSRRRGVEVGLNADEISKLKQSLSPTLSYISSIESKSGLLKALNLMLSDAKVLIEEANEHDSTKDRLLTTVIESPEMLAQIESQSTNTPETPLLNALTMPIIFKHYLQTINTKFQDGQLTISIFNCLKKDLNLYLLVFNQSTYNEILKTIWIFFGKFNLYQVESLVTEMENNGFPGDILTFNILKEITIDYYNLKMGDLKAVNNHLPIWSSEDDERISRIENKLRSISRNIKNVLSKTPQIH